MLTTLCEVGASPSATAGCEARPESESPRTGTTSARTIGRRAIGNSFQVRFRCGDSGHSGVLVCSFRCFPGAPGCACRLTSSASPPSTRSSQDPCPALAGRAKALLLHGFFPVRGLVRETRLSGFSATIYLTNQGGPMTLLKSAIQAARGAWRLERSEEDT